MVVRNESRHESKLDEIYYTGDKGPKFGSRHVQIIINAVGMGVMFSTKSMFTVLIVAMGDGKSSTNPDIPYYKWNNENVLISSMTWSSLAFQLIGGYLGKEYGPKWFTVGALLINGISFMLIPLAAATFGSTGVLICRLVQGIGQGLYNPLQTVVSASWIPPEERARLSYVITCGATTCIMLSSMVAGIVSKSTLGWPWGYYIFGSFNMAFIVIWILFMYENPERHPRITPEEKRYIQRSLKQDTTKKIPTPWLKIFTNIHVWANVVAITGLTFIMSIVMADKSLFLANIMKMDIESNGVIGSIPTLCATVSSAGLAFLSDYMIKSGRLSVRNSRRVFQLFGALADAGSLILLTYVPPEYPAWAIVILSFESICVGACLTGGSIINVFDISPAFAGIIQGVGNTFADGFGSLALLMVQWIVIDKTDVTQWRLAFIITAVFVTVSTIFFAIFVTDKRQDWESDTSPPKTDRKQSIISIEASLGKF